MSSNDYKVALLHLNVLGLIKVSKGFLPGSKSDASFGGVQRKWFSKACFVSRVQKKDIDEEFQKTKFTHFQRKVFKHIK